MVLLVYLTIYVGMLTLMCVIDTQINIYFPYLFIIPYFQLNQDLIGLYKICISISETFLLLT